MQLKIGKYINNISGLQIFQLIRYGTLFLINIVFAKCLPLHEIGTYQTLIFVAGLFTSFWISGLIQSFLPLFRNSKTFANKPSSGKSPELFNLFLLIFVLSLLAFIAVVIFERQIARVEFHQTSIPYFNLLLAYIFLSGTTFIIEYIYLVAERPGSIIKYGAVSFFIQFVLVTIPLFFNHGIKYCLIGLLVVTLIRLVWVIILLNRYSSFVVSIKFMREHLSLASPLIFSTLLSGFIPYVDGIIISGKLNEEAFAIFRYGAMELPIVYLLATAFSNAMVHEFSSGNISELLEKIKMKSLRLMHFLFPLTIMFLLLSNWLYPVLFSHDFSKSAGIFNVFLVLIISRLIFPQTILIGLKHTRVIMFASFFEIIINIILSLCFIKYFGIIGIAYATFIASVCEKLVSLSYCRIYLQIKPKEYIPLRRYSVYSFFTVMTYILVSVIIFNS